MTIVSLTIYDTLGKKIAVLINSQEQSSGIHHVIWNGENSYGEKVSSGIYFYQLIAANSVITKKMMMLK